MRTSTTSSTARSLDRASDDLALRRLKKRRLLLRDQIARIEAELEPPQPA